MPPESENTNRELLWNLRTAFSQKSAMGDAAPYCGHETTPEGLEAKLWEYAEADMPEDEAEQFWAQIQDCKYCLQKLLHIQQAINQTSAQGAYSLTQIKELIASKSKDNPLRIVLNWIKDSLELISTSGVLLPLEPIPVVRGSASTTDKGIGVAKEFADFSVQFLAEKTGPQSCNIAIKIVTMPASPILPPLRVTLKKAQRLIASHPLVGDQISFEDLSPGNYEITLLAGKDVRGQIALEIN